MRGATWLPAEVSLFTSHFNPRAPCGARQNSSKATRGQRLISIHAPHAGRDVSHLRRSLARCYFNPRAPCGARLPSPRPPSSERGNFNPRAPCGARRLDLSLPPILRLFQSTRPMRGATLNHWNHHHPKLNISIHAPHAGRDYFPDTVEEVVFQFQSTRPMRGATEKQPDAGKRAGFQSTRPMRGATTL